MFPRHEAWNNMTKNGDNIVIVSHPTPDGDALGSAFALAEALEIAGKKPVVLLDQYSEKFNFLSGKKFIYKGDAATLDCDVFIAVDCGEAKRISSAENLFNRSLITINIDHHLNNKNFARFNYIDPGASSTCEIIFNIINMYTPITKDIAEALYTGIVTDTGCFRHSNTTPHTMEIVAMLMRANIDFGEIQRRAIHANTRVEAAIFAKALQNIQYLEKHPVAYTCLKPEEMDEAGAKYADLDGIAEYLLNIEGISASAFFTQRPGGQVKVSMRSLGPDVSAIAAKFGGGGHKFAAAAQFAAEFEDGVKQVLEALRAAVKV